MNSQGLPMKGDVAMAEADIADTIALRLHPIRTMLAGMTFPNLKAMFSRSARVEAFVQHPKLPKVPLGKVEPSGGDPMMTEYVRHARPSFSTATCRFTRRPRRGRNGAGVPIVRPDQRRVGFLGFG